MDRQVDSDRETLKQLWTYDHAPGVHAHGVPGEPGEPEATDGGTHDVAVDTSVSTPATTTPTAPVSLEELDYRSRKDVVVAAMGTVGDVHLTVYMSSEGTETPELFFVRTNSDGKLLGKGYELGRSSSGINPVVLDQDGRFLIL